MAPKRDDDEPDIQRARGAREVREHYEEEKPRIFDPSNWFFKGGQLMVAAVALWGVAVGFNNYNHRLEQQDARIRRLERNVIYTSEFKAWVKVFQLKNAGKLDAPDPADFTIDRTE